MKPLPYSLLLLVFCLLCCAVACHVSPPPLIKTGRKPVENITLPPGFTIELYAKGVVNARSMCLGNKGTLFAGTRNEGNVYAIKDTNGDYLADSVITIASGLNMPNGVAFRNGALYVAEVNKIWRYDNIEDNLIKPPKPVLVNGSFPTETHHGWKYIAFGPDDKLYVPVGAPCNICESDDERFASIMRMNPDGTGLEVFASGIRNTVGFTWHPETNELWFTDNGRDWLGDDLPPCELNRASKQGLHFGYPYCHGGSIADPEFGSKHPCSDFVPPIQNLGPHVAPLGVIFYTGNMFPPEYKNRIFIAEHGSWNRSKKIGYRLTTVALNEQQMSAGYKPFAEGWLPENGKVWGRPVALLQLPDGSLLVSDDFADCIYRITYAAN
ncbi:sorbosone dehydrogenase family protein [Sphingobacteriales bacterium UPWRP_1]|nr:sorbosone dehydrogenase [Sphingobacteriales bacterium TSM_CSS]PSJ77709.1 sorbosone dehydrogenase family protein [Sphingobacteriales bacterium UPWRP_1]